MKDKGKEGWTSGSITFGRLNGLKIRAEKNHRSYGQELEEILHKAGVPILTAEEYEKKKLAIKKGEKN